MLRMIKSPRLIDVSLIETGDLISVEHKPSRGVTTTLKGVVSKRVDSGTTRYLMTEEGATLVAWEPGKINRFKITLFGREEPEEYAMFELPNEVAERIAS